MYTLTQRKKVTSKTGNWNIKRDLLFQIDCTWNVPSDSPSRGRDVVFFVVVVVDINQPSLPTPFYSVLVSISVFVAISTAFRSINSPDNSPLSHSVLPVLYLPHWSCQLYIILMNVSFSPDRIPCSWPGLKRQLTKLYFESFIFAYSDRIRNRQRDTCLLTANSEAHLVTTGYVLFLFLVTSEMFTAWRLQFSCLGRLVAYTKENEWGRQTSCRKTFCQKTKHVETDSDTHSVI